MEGIPTRREVAPRETLSSKSLAVIGIPRLLFDAELEDYNEDEEVKTVISRYIKYIHDMYEDCVNLTFYGKNGNGKTFLTSIIVKEAYRHYYSSFRTTVARYISVLWKSDKDEKDYQLIDRIKNTEFLVLDELGKEPNTSKGNELIALDELMKYREEQGFPTIICTNLNLEDVKKNYGATFNSMIQQSVKLEMRGDDKRRDTFKNRKGVSLLLGEGD